MSGKPHACTDSGYNPCISLLEGIVFIGPRNEATRVPTRQNDVLAYTSLVPRPFWEGETAWQHPPVQTVYGRNVTAIAYLIQSVKST